MKQQRTGKRRAYVRGPICQVCRKVLREGEEDLIASANSRYDKAHHHRFCLEQWLIDHPPLEKSKAPLFLIKQEEAEKEFKRIRRKILRDIREQAKRVS